MEKREKSWRDGRREKWKGMGRWMGVLVILVALIKFLHKKATSRRKDFISASLSGLQFIIAGDQWKGQVVTAHPVDSREMNACMHTYVFACAQIDLSALTELRTPYPENAAALGGTGLSKSVN